MSEMNPHFTELQWLGFVLDCCPQDTAAAIEQHLAMECAACVREQAYWRTLHSSMKQEAEVPAWAVEQVMALPGEPAPEATRREGARLVFDNLSTPMPAYLRSGGGYSRHCVYSLSESASVEVLVERISRQQGWSVVGQVLDEEGRGWGDCKVQLTDERDCWQATTTNAAGEFAFAQAGQGANLVLELEAGECRWEIPQVLLPQ